MVALSCKSPKNNRSRLNLNLLSAKILAISPAKAVKELRLLVSATSWLMTKKTAGWNVHVWLVNVYGLNCAKSINT